MIICPVCGGVADYNSYFGKFTCTRCALQLDHDAFQELKKVMKWEVPAKEEKNTSEEQ